MAISEKSKSSISPFDFVIFGATGDLAFRKIFPALYHRLAEGQMKDSSRVLGFSQSELSTEEFRVLLSDNLRKHDPFIDEKVLKLLLKLTSFSCGDATAPEGYDEIGNWLKGTKNNIRVYYLATGSSIFGPICHCLDHNNLITENTRVVLEKPLGKDGKSSEAINKQVNSYFSERQIYRIDHYLGKETVQNLMVLRFANNLYEQIWNANNIQNVQITVSESIGVESRGDYYDNYGALLDMVQNHLLQLLCLIAMEPPTVLKADEVQKEKLKVMKSLRFYTKNNVGRHTIKGQYTGSETGTGKNKIKEKSYLEDVELKKSETETFVAIRTYVDNWRWAGVPFYLRTGKRMGEKYSEITINFKNVPHNIFPENKRITNNKLIIRLQPEESIQLVQMVKVAGPGGYRYKPVALTLDYSASFGGRFPGAYERLMMDVVRGNQTLFMSREEVRASWDWIESITENWEATKQKIFKYNSSTEDLGEEVLKEGDKWYVDETE